MAKNLNRTLTAGKSGFSAIDGSRSSQWFIPGKGTSFREVQRLPEPHRWRDVPDHQNPVRPPYHWHWKQTEYLRVKQGRFIFKLNGKDFPVTAASGVIVIPPKVDHTLKPDPTCEEECIIEASASEAQHGIDERFFRNLYSYTDDCQKAGVAPSFIQLLLFLHASEISLALPGPHFIAHPASYVFGLVVGKWIGQNVLGYQASYKEYYDSNTIKDSERDG